MSYKERSAIINEVGHKLKEIELLLDRIPGDSTNMIRRSMGNLRADLEAVAREQVIAAFKANELIWKKQEGH